MTTRTTKRTESRGTRLVASIIGEMAVLGCEPTVTEAELLALARVLANRIATLECVIATEGEMLTSSTGVVRVHPAAVEHRQLTLTLSRVLGGVVIGDSSAGRNPVKQRAARARWANRDRDREREAVVRQLDSGA